MTDGKRVFKVDARALISLGRESIKDHTTALIELVKNAYDADAENVEIEIDTALPGGRIRIADDGVGMKSSDIDTKFLRIGYSEKRKRKVSKKGRRETGEKGIGRLSADRLGAVLELRSKAKGSDPVGIRVHWDDFDVDGAEIGSVNIEDLKNPQPLMGARPGAKNFTESGTEIAISRLRQSWVAADFQELETELATLVPGKNAKADFQLWLRTDGDGEFVRVSSAFDAAAELELEGQFDSRGKLTYSVTAPPLKTGQKRHNVKNGTLAWSQVVNSSEQIAYDIGKVGVTISFYPRKSVNLSSSVSLGQLKEFLDTQGGIRIYRDGIKVKPYGDPNHPEGDWLSLAERKARNPAGAARKDFRIAANQLVGYVEIGRDTNPMLADSAAREGLIHGPGFAVLKSAVFGCIALLELFYHERFKGAKAASPAPIESIPVVLLDIKSRLGTVKRDLSEAEKSADRKDSVKLRATMEQLAAVSEQVSRAEKEFEELASQNTVYRGLATVGISTAVFAHETESALAQAKGSASLALKAISSQKPNIELGRTELVKVEKAVAKVGVWGQFAISRVKKDKRKRTKVDVSKIVGSICDEVAPLYSAAGIELVDKISPTLETRAFVMDIEALALNLLTNAFHHASLSSKARKVSISLHAIGKGDDRKLEIEVSDSGSGIAKEHLPHIWTPLFSTKVDRKGRSVGTGLGLTIVKSIVDEMNGSVIALPKSDLGGASFKIQLPFRS